jgi:formylglycine-generating enzyme required for sulfatase activity
MGNSPSNFKGSDRLPVEEVSWNDCQEFFRKAGGGLRLPTEAEWEYACRAGTTTPFNTGETISTDEANYERSYLDGIGRKGGTVEVGSFRANAWGVFDMHGNVWEWCSDWYGPYPSGLVTDPTGAASGAKRVLRGGSWHLNPRKCRSALRGRDAPDNRNDNFGLRVALDF